MDNVEKMKLLLHIADEKEIVYNFLVLFGVFYIQISSQILNFAQRHKLFFYISLVIFQKNLSDSLLILIKIFKPIFKPISSVLYLSTVIY